MSNSDQPYHGHFILTSGIPYEWRSPQNDNLWQGANGVNNPCSQGYRLPTTAEWVEETESWSKMDSEGALESTLKLPMPGTRIFSGGEEIGVGSYGFYWSSTISSYSSLYMCFANGAGVNRPRICIATGRAWSKAIRCIRD